MKNKYILIILALYSLLLLRLIVFKYPPGIVFDFANANLIPFKTIFPYLSGEPTFGIAVRNILGNIVVFIPFGFLLAFIWKTSGWKNFLLTGILIGIIIEVMQVIFKSGIFDVDDIILNSLGVLFGYLFYVSIKNIFKKNKA